MSHDGRRAPQRGAPTEAPATEAPAAGASTAGASTAGAPGLARRLERDTRIVLALSMVAASAVGGWRMAGGVLGGGLLLAISYRALKRGVDAIGAPPAGQERRPPLSPARVAIGLVGRYALLLVAGYVMIGRLHLDPLGVLVGVSAVVVAAMVEAVRSWR